MMLSPTAAMVNRAVQIKTTETSMLVSSKRTNVALLGKILERFNCEKQPNLQVAVTPWHSLEI